mgnify:FL=1
MHCYYQGTLQVTGGNINDVERTAMKYIGKWIYVEGIQENSGTLLVDFSDASTVCEDDVRGFVAEAAEHDWNVNGTLSYYGDYEGFMVITNNVIEEISPEEMVIRKYLDTPSVKAEKELADKAVSMASYLFLRMIYAKEAYPQTVVENMEWIIDELLEDHPAEILIQNLKQELEEGVYEGAPNAISLVLSENFGLDEIQCHKIIKMLQDWIPVEEKENV